MVLPSSSVAVTDDGDHQRPVPMLPSGRPVPPFKPPGLFARTSGLLAAAAAASIVGSEVELSLSNGDGVDEFEDDDDDDDDDEFDDDEEEDWDDEYERDEDQDDTAADTAALQVILKPNNNSNILLNEN